VIGMDETRRAEAAARISAEANQILEAAGWTIVEMTA